MANEEHELLMRLQSGDQDAWSEFVTVYSPVAYNYLYHNLPTIEDTEDVLGETMSAFVGALQRFDGAVLLKTFLLAIAHRKMVDFWRKHKPVDELSESISQQGTDTAIVEFEELLDQLSEPSRQVLILRYQLGFSVSEIAQIRDISYKATESQLSRARAQLKALMVASADESQAHASLVLASQDPTGFLRA